jgi:hypothetical protein
MIHSNTLNLAASSVSACLFLKVIGLTGGWFRDSSSKV